MKMPQKVHNNNNTLNKLRADLPGLRKSEQLLKIAVNKPHDLKHTEVDDGLVYSLGSNFPDYKIDSAEAEKDLHHLMHYVTQRLEKRNLLSDHLDKRCNNFRVQLMHMEKENLSLRSELASLKAVYRQQQEHSSALEKKLRIYENSIDVLKLKVSNRERQIDDLSRKLNAPQNLRTLNEQVKKEQKVKHTSKMIDKTDRELEIKLREQRAKLQEKMRIKDEKIRLVSNIIQWNDLPYTPQSESAENLIDDVKHSEALQKQQHFSRADSIQTDALRTELYTAHRHVRGLAAANTRHRRSHSAGEKWLEHRTPNPVPLGTIMQPCLKNRKLIKKLTELKDLTSHKATKYCLVSQEADTDGDVETKLFKGNVIPTCGGGAQVVFDDVECLKQKPPISSPYPKHLITGSSTVFSGAASALSAVTSIVATQKVASRCNVGIEGHSTYRTKL